MKKMTGKYLIIEIDELNEESLTMSLKNKTIYAGSLSQLKEYIDERLEYIPRKWEMIVEILKSVKKTEKTEEFLQDAIKTAMEIDTAVFYITGDRHTANWLDSYEEFQNYKDWTDQKKVRIVRDKIAREYTFCTPCMEYIHCNTCNFGQMVGVCDSSNSLFKDFITLINKLIWLIEDE